MVYILAINPQILSVTGMESAALFTATALMCIIGSAMMGILAKYPYALAPGMGLNAFFAYVVAAEVGWQTGLFLLVIQGLLFMVLAMLKFRDALFNAIPRNIKYSFGVGIGLFIAHIGMQNAGFIVSSPATLVSLGDMHSITSLLFLAGCVFTSALIIRGVRGGMFLGIMLTYLLGLLAQAAGLYIPGVHGHSLVPDGIIAPPPSIAPVSLFTNWQYVNLAQVGMFTIVSLVLILLLVEVLDSVGTLIGMSERAGILDKDGNMPRVGRALFTGAATTTLGAVLGTSTVTTYIESATGIQAGGRTGLTAVFTAVFFAAATLFWPVFAVIPAFATAPALIIVGVYMTSIVTKINFEDFSEAFPAVLVIILMPLTFSISDAVVFGVVSYVALKLLTGRAHQVSGVMYVLAILFSLKLIFPY